MLKYRNHLCNRDDMIGQIRVLTETKQYYISEWRITDVMQLILWHEQFECQIHHIVPDGYGLLTVISEKPSETFKIQLIDQLRKYYNKNPKSTNLYLGESSV